MLEREVCIGGRLIGPQHPPLVIAEIGINHGGDLNIAKNMVALAAKAGAECVKHQTHFVSDEMTDEAKAIYPPNADISIWDVMEKAALTPEEEIELKLFAESLDLLYLSTPFSRKAADFLNDINVPAFKIGSGECDNIPLIRHIAKMDKPIIMSTGMQSINSIRRSVDVLDLSNVPYILLECTNLYPSPPEIVSLKGVKDLQNAFPNCVVGFSDHSIGPEMALASVALGACVIERHFTDTRYRLGPDISCSMDPSELKLLIDRSKEIHIASRNMKRRSESEEEVYKFARGSVVADKFLPKGHVITEDDIWVRRPGTGEIAASEFDEVVGCRVAYSLDYNTQLKWTDFEK